MYIIFGQKTKGARKEFPLNTQIKFLSDIFANECWILSLPGHMSRGDKVATYINDFNELINRSVKEQYIGFGNGYSSVNSRDAYIGEIQSNNAKYLLRNYRIDLSNLQKRKNDHSKMLFYFQWGKDSLLRSAMENGCELSSDNIEAFFREISVIAIIIGSSNQSWQTYFKKPADKGEADVLLLSSITNGSADISNEIAFLKDVIRDRADKPIERYLTDNKEFFEQNIISKSLFSFAGDKTETEYLTEIMRRCLYKE